MNDNEEPECTNVEEKKAVRTKYIFYFFVGIFVIGIFIMMARVSTSKSKKSSFQSTDIAEASDGELDNISEHMAEDNHYQLYDEIEAFIGKQAEYIASQN